MVDVVGGLTLALDTVNFIRTMVNNYAELKEQLEETLTNVTALEEIIKRRSHINSFNQREMEDFLRLALVDLQRLDQNLKSPAFRTSVKEKLGAGQRLDELASLNARLETRRNRFTTDVLVSMEQTLQNIASVSSIENPNATNWWARKNFDHEISAQLFKHAVSATFDEEAAKPGTTFVKEERNTHNAIIDLIVDFQSKLCNGEKVTSFKFKEFSQYGDLPDIYMNVARWKKEGKQLGRGLIIATPGCILMDKGSYKAAVQYFKKQLEDYQDENLRFFLKDACDKIIGALTVELAAEENFKKNAEGQLAVLRRTHPTGGENVLQGKLLSAANLLGVDLGGTSDPYAIITIGKQKFTTPRKDKTCNPIWDFEFKAEKVSTTDQLKVSVMDWNKLISDKPLGEIAPITLRAVTSNVSVADYPLSLKNKQQGTIKLQLQMTNEINALMQHVSSSAEKIKLMQNSLEEVRGTLNSDLLKEQAVQVTDAHGKLVVAGLFHKKEFLDWDEFLRLMSEHMRARPQDVEELRLVLDRNRDGKIRRDEFEQFFKWFNPITVQDRYKRVTKPNPDSTIKEWTVGTVAELLRQPWFHPLVDGVVAEDKLKNEPPGTFIVRFSSSAGSYAISLKTSDSSSPVYQWKITPSSDNKLVIYGLDDQYNNLYQIVDIYKNKHLENDPNVPFLSRPCPK